MSINGIVSTSLNNFAPTLKDKHTNSKNRMNLCDNPIHAVLQAVPATDDSSTVVGWHEDAPSLSCSWIQPLPSALDSVPVSHPYSKTGSTGGPKTASRVEIAAPHAS